MLLSLAISQLLETDNILTKDPRQHVFGEFHRQTDDADGSVVGKRRKLPSRRRGSTARTTITAQAARGVGVDRGHDQGPDS